LQRSSRSWSIECRISAASFTLAKRAATAASYVNSSVSALALVGAPYVLSHRRHLEIGDRVQGEVPAAPAILSHGRRADQSEHFLLKDRFLARVPASLAVGTVGPFGHAFGASLRTSSAEAKQLAAAGAAGSGLGSAREARRRIQRFPIGVGMESVLGPASAQLARKSEG
jgi:hypothetical protein